MGTRSIPDIYDRILFLSDLHAPYHHPVALREVYQRALEFRPDLIVLGGDMLDFYGLSRFSQDPHAPDMQVELDTAAKLLAPFTSLAPCVYLWGNHERRLTKWLFKTPAMATLRMLNLSALLGDAGLEPDLYCDHLHIGPHLILTHGMLFGVGAARTMSLRCPGKTVVQGHSHFISSFTVENFGVVSRCYTSGLLGDQSKMDYVNGRYPQWCRGWTEIERGAKWWRVTQQVCTRQGANLPTPSALTPRR